jgi:hypothetical protein
MLRTIQVKIYVIDFYFMLAALNIGPGGLFVDTIWLDA